MTPGLLYDTIANSTLSNTAGFMKRYHRICIIGNAGSGKTTFARELGKALALPVYHLDRHMLYPDYTKLPDDQYFKIHTDITQKDEWIIDGNYNRTIEERIQRATLVIFLNVSRLKTFPRVLRRAFITGQDKDSIPEGARTKQFNLSFLHWAATYSRKERIKTLSIQSKNHNVPLMLLGKGSISDWIKQTMEKLKEIDNQ